MDNAIAWAIITQDNIITQAYTITLANILEKSHVHQERGATKPSDLADVLFNMQRKKQMNTYSYTQ